MNQRSGQANPQQQRPPFQRHVSSSHALQHGLKRPQLPSRLSGLRSVSQPVNIVDLTAEGAKSADARNSAAFANNTANLTTSPQVISLDDDDNPRPSKRAKTNGNAAGKAQSRRSASDSVKDAAHQTLPGSPLPQLRAPVAATNKQNAQRTRRTVVDRAARRAHGLEPPSMATKLPAPKTVADFAPWNGHHPEDIMSETVVKAGYFDKPSGPNSTESNSAKPSIWPNLSQKNNMGLQTLSYLFTSVMEKRQANGRCTAPSTFKPPPRVTVTDTKREAWLRDLSNPDVPLRKQSRTIPHGIRGKLLMEQCLGKNIAMPRAIWLAKCVGANELRAFRRKGVSGTAAASGESKWVREWTVQLEQFLEGVIAACGQEGWQPKMDYAVRLATGFYSERLLEREHYLDWIVTSFSGSSVDKLPIWIILVQLYWKDVTLFGKRGRRLSTAILRNLDQIATGYLRVCDSLRDRLKKLLVVMAVTNRGCLILPNTWERYKHLLAPKPLVGTNTTLDTPAQNVTRRNTRLNLPLNKTPQNTQCASLRLYAMLDFADLDLDTAKLAEDCLAIGLSVESLIVAVLHWSASVYRAGPSRVYLSSKLITHWHRNGYNTDDTILEYLKTASVAAISNANIHLVIAELVRASCFSTGRYLMHLIGSGALASKESSSLLTGLLQALPLDALPPHLINTRQTLMNRAGHKMDEKTSVNAVMTNMDLTGSLAGSVMDRINDMNQSAKFEFARQLTTFSKTHGISLNWFCTVREVLERCGDLQALSNVVQAAIPTDDFALLATLSDTVSLYAGTFAAIGSLHTMLDQILQRYRVLRSTQPLDRSSVLALASLVKRFPNQALHERLLEGDLAMCDQQDSMAVCSPASDNLVSMQASSLDSDEDIDAVFASGNTMDEQLMQRVFGRIVQRATKPGRPSLQAPSKLATWFNQLRAVDASGFEQLAKAHVTNCFKDVNEDPAHGRVISTLIASGCMPFETVLELGKDVNLPTAASLVVRLVTRDDVANDGLHASEVFRYRAEQASCRLGNAEAVLSCMVSSLENPRCEADDESFTKLGLEYSVSHDRDRANAFSEAPGTPISKANCARLVRRMLRLKTTASADAEDSPSARSIISRADPLSIVQCTAALSFYCKTPDANTAEGQDELREALLEAIANGCEVWPQLLGSAGQNTAQSVYYWAREQALEYVGTADNRENSQSDICRCLDILDVAYHAAQGADVGPVVGTVTEKLRAVESQLNEVALDTDEDETYRQLLDSLRVLLHLAVLYSTDSGPLNDARQQNRLNLLAALCALLVHRKLQTRRELLEYIFDVASTLADNIPEAELQALAKTNVTTAKDARLASILGNAASPDGWLALVTHIASQGGSQQQRALMKQAGPSQQQQSPVQGRPIPGSMPHTLGLQVKTRSNAGETKTVPFPLRRWEMMSDATPTVGDNDTSLSLSLFGARKV